MQSFAQRQDSAAWETANASQSFAVMRAHAVVASQKLSSTQWRVCVKCFVQPSKVASGMWHRDQAQCERARA